MPARRGRGPRARWGLRPPARTRAAGNHATQRGQALCLLRVGVGEHAAGGQREPPEGSRDGLLWAALADGGQQLVSNASNR